MWKTCNRFMHDTLRALLGPRAAWGLASGARRQSRDLPARLQDAFDRVSPETRFPDEQPVFLFSAGWRSGSTLLQRMIMENNEDILIWGEPFDHSNIHDSLVDQFRAFNRYWPPDAYFISRMDLKNPSDSWVANLYPDIDHLMEAHRSFYRTLFAEPTLRAGRKNWGFKEVRLTIDHATYLRALYPRCKIILLYRNPLDAYHSYRKWRGGAFRTWPKRHISTPYAFGNNWAEITRGYLIGHKAVDALLIRYEDLDNAADVERLQAYLGWAVPCSSAMRRIPDRHSDRSPATPKTTKLPTIDRVLLKLATGSVLGDAGYSDT